MRGVELRFSERMAGRLEGEVGGVVGFALEARATGGWPLRGPVVAEVDGSVALDGVATAAPVRGTLTVDPFGAGEVRYELAFVGDDDGSWRLEGAKSLDWRRPLRSWTELPVTLLRDDPGGAPATGAAVVAHGSLRFALGDLPGFLAGMRVGGVALAGPAAPLHAAELFTPRSGAKRGRVEVWYDTFSDPRTGAGFWLHHEVLVPLDGSGPRAHGVAAIFVPGGAPRLGRFGPEPLPGGEWSRRGFATAAARSEPGAREGSAGALSWRLEVEEPGPPLWSLPALAWRREVLPSAHVVASPSARYSGVVVVDGERFELRGARGASARTYGRANPERWGWCHVELDGLGVLDAVVAESPVGPLRRLGPLALVGLRRPGRPDWPRRPLLALRRWRAELHEDGFSLAGTVDGSRLELEAHVPPQRAVAVDYPQPDGSTVVCRNSERADARVRFEPGGRGGRGGEWRVEARAHAEIGGAG